MQESIQAAPAVLMVAPTSFGYDEQTAATNTFQHHLSDSSQAIQQSAMAEFEAFVAQLQAHDIQVFVYTDTPTPPKPNAVFPNNWLSTWPDGWLYLYPMATDSRRIERVPAVIEELKQRYTVTRITDLSAAEKQGKHLESTGVMVFDHDHRKVYACLSPRCDEQLLRRHAEVLRYEPVVFGAYDLSGVSIYHTNVLMGIQTTTAVVCAEAITDIGQREQVLGHLRRAGKQIVTITLDQMAHFCGNVLEVRNAKGEHFLVLSQSAYDAFTPEQRAVLAQDKTLLPVAIPTIEAIGGGSARCMLAELFLPEKIIA